MQSTAGEWIVDGTINLSTVCADANWHRLTVIDELVAKGVARADAAAFVDFIFCDHANVADDNPDDVVTEAQYERLTVA